MKLHCIFFAKIHNETEIPQQNLHKYLYKLVCYFSTTELKKLE